MIMVDKANGRLKNVPRDPSDQKFHTDEVDMEDTPQSFSSKVNLKVNKYGFAGLLKLVQWQSLYRNFDKKDVDFSERVLEGFVTQFFTDSTKSAKE
jgi:hypothetical protein